MMARVSGLSQVRSRSAMGSEAICHPFTAPMDAPTTRSRLKNVEQVLPRAHLVCPKQAARRKHQSRQETKCTLGAVGCRVLTCE